MSASKNNGEIESSRFSRLIIYLVFFLSGTAALIYEISWSRQIGLLFGHTVHAASVVLASYFAGMSIGYWVGGKWSTRVSPLLGYAIAEWIVAGWAFMIPMLLTLSESSTFAPWLSSSSFAWQTSARAIFSFFLLLPATISLGVTLPMMAAYFSGGVGNLTDANHATRVTLAYAVNTCGAVVGVGWATFYLLVVVGVCGSSYLAAALSAACALTALFLSIVEGRRTSKDCSSKPWVRGNNLGRQRRSSRVFCEAEGETEGEAEGEAVDSSSSSPDSNRCSLAFLWGLSFLSGFGTLALQVLYTRMFSLVFHNSTYTFGIVIIVFLGALSVGAGLAAVLQRWFRAKPLVGVTTGIGSLATVISVLVFVEMTELKYFGSGDSFAGYMGGALMLVTAVVAPAIVCLGMLLPFVWTLAGPSESAGRVVGRLTAVNTMAAAAGALAASFCLLTWIGLWHSVVFIAILFFLAAFILLWQAQQRFVACVLGLLLATFSALAIRSPIESENDQANYQERLIHRWNSPYGWIDVVQHEKSGAFKIRQNLHYRFGKTGTNAREFRLAHIPLLLHEHPQDVLFMGLGTGLTAGGAIPHQDVDHIWAVELIPEVVEAVRRLADYNHHVVDHPKVEIHIDDARHFLLANDRKYDVIVSDMFVPWESESGYLYTVEHYHVAAQRLKPGGLFCQWLPLYQVGEREFESIANSFASEFPQATLWWGDMNSSSPVIALIGSVSPLKIDEHRLSIRLTDLSQQLGSIDPAIETCENFWDHYIGDWEPRSISNLNTDEHPRVEFLTPISNRDRQMLRTQRLECYYNKVLSKLPSDEAQLTGDRQYERSSSRLRQRLILFRE